MNEQLIPKFENEIKEELKLLVESMIDENGQKFDPFHHVHIFTTNIACYMCFGKRFEHTNPAFSELVLALREFMKAYIGSTMLNFQPLMWYLPIQKVKSLRTSHAKLITAISKLNDENLSHDEPQDMEFSYQMVDLIINCSETVCATILWTIVHMAQNRHVQEQHGLTLLFMMWSSGTSLYLRALQS
ncbi:cytochrome P450 2U1-like [Saccoglossus kowalevskii]